jgi:hypothetical protein
VEAFALGDNEETTDELPVERAVKFVGPDTIEGLAMPFGEDVDGEQFTKSTDLCIDWFGSSGRPLLYNHGLDSAHKAQKVGQQTEYEERDGGIWAQAQLNANARYRKHIDGLIEKGALGYSSGAYPHLATKNRAGELTRWPWVELSLTPFPAHPGALGVHFVKSSAEFLDYFDDIPEPLKAAMAALDEWAETRDDEGLPDGLKFAEHADRLLADVEAFRLRTGSIADLRAKAGRVLSASTRERLLRHPASLRELADDLDGLLSDADAGKSMSDLSDSTYLAERAYSRFLGVDLPAERNQA